MPFQPGNKLAEGGRKEKPWRDALMRAVARSRSGKDPKALDKMADKTVALAIKGEGWAVKEVGDRLDGKPAQQQIVVGDEDGGPVLITRVEIVAAGDDGKN